MYNGMVIGMSRLLHKKIINRLVAGLLLPVLLTCSLLSGQIPCRTFAAVDTNPLLQTEPAGERVTVIEKIKETLKGCVSGRENHCLEIREKIEELSAPYVRSDSYYYATGDNYDYKGQYFYDDSYFYNDASEYNPSLATMSMCLTTAAFASNTARSMETKSRNAVKLLQQTGFEDVEVNEDFKKTPTIDSIGIVVGHKYIVYRGKMYTLLAVGLRGAGYGAEWASNLTIGTSGRHKGFGDAAIKVESFLEDYISRNEEAFTDDIKIWITGFSRSAAVTNLVSADISMNGEIAGHKASMKNIYAYCFEAPQGEHADNISKEEAQKLTNIHNIINPCDPIPQVAFKSWNFFRYGTDEPVISVYDKDSIASQKMLKKYAAMRTNCTASTLVYEKEEFGHDGMMHIFYKYQAKKFGLGIDFNLGSDFSWDNLFSVSFLEPSDSGISLSTTKDDDKPMQQFLEETIAAIATGFSGREDYHNRIEPTAAILAAEFANQKYENCDFELLPNLLSEKLGEHSSELVEAIFSGWVDGVSELLTQYILECLREAGADLPEDASLDTAASAAISSLIQAAIYSLFSGEGGNILTLINNVDLLAYAHYPELCMAWLQSQDINYYDIK